MVVTHILTAAAVKNIPDYARKDLLTTKGDLFVATGAGALTRLAVGSNGQFLQADSAQSTGLAWVAVPGAACRGTIEHHFRLGSVSAS